jgi:spermidine/putrescine transport system substrate-binding protein
MDDRRSILARALALVALALLAAGAVSPPAGAAKEVRVLNWQGYGTDEAWAIEAFEKRHGAKVVHDYFNSEQEMLTKLRTSPGTYDVVLINSSFTEQAAAEGLIQPIDPAKIRNFKDLSPALRDHAYLNPGGKTYGVAWVWGVTSFAYDTADVKERPTSIEALWDPKFKGKVGWRDDAVESVQMAAIATGQDPNKPSDFGKIREKLKELKPQLATFWSSEDEWNKHVAANQFDIAVYWSGSAARSKKAFNLPIEFVIPKEGAIGWFDGLSIPTNAPNVDLANAFIDYMVDPEFYVRWDTDVGAPASANAVANAALPEDAMNRQVLGDPEVTKRLYFMAPLSDQQRQEYLELWQETKTYIAQ